jgi:hypothetical protein
VTEEPYGQTLGVTLVDDLARYVGMRGDPGLRGRAVGEEVEVLRR